MSTPSTATIATAVVAEAGEERGGGTAWTNARTTFSNRRREASVAREDGVLLIGVCEWVFFYVFFFSFLLRIWLHFWLHFGFHVLVTFKNIYIFSIFRSNVQEKPKSP